MVRSPHPHARIVGIDAAAARAMPGVLGIFTGADCAGRRPQADPAQPAAVDADRSQADRARRRQGVRRPASSAGDRQSAPCRRGRRHGGCRQSGAGARRRGSGRRRLRDAGLGGRCESRLRTRRAGGVGRSAGQRAGRHHVRRCRGDRPRLCRRRSCGQDGFSCGARHRRGLGAARGAGSLRCDQRPLHLARRQRRRGAAETRDRQRARDRARAAAGSVLRCRRQLRFEEPALRRVRRWCCGPRTSSAVR